MKKGSLQLIFLILKDNSSFILEALSDLTPSDVGRRVIAAQSSCE